MKQLFYTILLIICATVSYTLFGQNEGLPIKAPLSLLDTLSNKEKRQMKRNAPPKKGDLYLLITPTIGYNPSYGFMYGLGGSISSYFGDPENTLISSALLGVNYTTKKQLIINMRSTVFTNHNNWLLNGDWRYMNSSQPTYGLGTGPASTKLASNGFELEDGLFSQPITTEQQMGYKFIRLYETVSKKFGKYFYFGVGYHLDVFTDVKDELVDLSATPPIITSYYAYNQKYGFDQIKNTTSGISLNATFDSRDNQNSAYKGQFANLSFRVNPEFLGSTKNSTMLSTEYRGFLNLTKVNHNMLCLWLMGNFTTSGQLPYMNLPAIGWDQYNKTGRGYTQGRFRGEHMVYGEIEFRKHLLSLKKIPDFLGMVFFANATTATNKAAQINLFEYINPAAGLGLNVMLVKKARTKFGIDYAWGNYNSNNFYIRINEAF